MREVLVIGGNRYFGKRLIARLLAAGDRVTVLNRGSAPPPPGVIQLIADRDDEASLAAAVGERTFDVVVDQVCYTPHQAAIARRVFTGRTARYVMTRRSRCTSTRTRTNRSTRTPSTPPR